MAQNPHVPSDPQALAGDSIPKKVARRRIAIASGVAAGAAFIAAGLLAGPSLFPGVLDDLRERDLLPVHVIGSGGHSAPGQTGSAGEGGDAGGTVGAGASSDGGGGDSSRGGSGGSGSGPSTDRPPAPSVILPGGVNLKDVLEDTTDGLQGTIDNAKGFTKETVDCVVADPTKTLGCVDGAVDGGKNFIDQTTSTLPVPLPELPVTIPTVPGLPTTIPDLPVTIPTIPTTPTVTVPPTTLPTTPTIPVTVPTVPLTVPTVPALTVPETTLPPLGGLL